MDGHTLTAYRVDAVGGEAMWQAPFCERVAYVRRRRPQPIGFANKYGNPAKRTAVNFS